jgi:catechol 2,3-dioxygenase-like lactoylglutathione lyase family enzyme
MHTPVGADLRYQENTYMEGPMTTTTQEKSNTSTAQPVATSVPMRFEVTTLPVSDVDRAKAFYLGLGWHLEADLQLGEHARVVQITPTGSPASIHFGEGRTTATPGSLDNLYLIVDDVEAARADLISHGAEVSEIWHNEPGKGKVAGVDPEHNSYNSYATFSDPDGNTWLLQELTQRLPGRVRLLDAPKLAERLLETSLRHGAFEAVAPEHHWWDWYAAYMDAREHGATPDESSLLADAYMAEVKHVVIPTE